MKRFSSVKSKKRLILGVTVAVVALCLLVHLLPFTAVYPDWSGNRTYAVSETSKRYLKGISEDVEIIYYSEGGRRNADKDLYSFVLRLAAQSDRIRVRVEDPMQTGADAGDQSILIRSAKREKLLSIAEMFYYFNTYYGIPMTIEEYAKVIGQMQSITDVETYKAYLSVYGPAQMQVNSTLDRSLTSAVRYVLADRAPRIGVYSNLGSSMNALLRASLEQSGYEVEPTDALDEISADCEALYLELAKDLTQPQGEALRAYLEAGGKLFLTTAYTMTETPVLSQILAEYGLSSPNVMNLLYGSSQSTQFMAVSGDHPITDRIGDSFVVSYAHLIETTPVEGVTQSVLLRTPENSFFIRSDLKQGETPEIGSFAVGVLAEREESAVLWLSTLQDSMVNGMSGGANFAFVLAGMNDLTGFSGSTMSIADTALPSTYLGATTSVVGVWILVFAVLLPAGVLIAGGVRCYVRKKRS